MIKLKWLMILFVWVAFSNAEVVYWTPSNPVPGGTVTIYYNLFEGSLPNDTNPVYIHIGYNGWSPFLGDFAMSDSGNGWWSYIFQIPDEAEIIDFVFTDLQGNWDNNGGYGVDYHISMNVTWEPFRPGANDSVYFRIRNCTQGGSIVWQVRNEGYLVPPIDAYRPTGSSVSEDGRSVETPLQGPDASGTCEVVFPPFRNLRQMVELVRIRIRWNDGNMESSVFDLPIDYTPGEGDPQIQFVYPEEGDTISGPAEISINAENSISVEFWGGYDSLGIIESEPFSINWTPTNLAFGNSSLRVKAVNDSGRVTLARLPVYIIPQVQNIPAPESISDGVTVSGNQVTFALYAPFKEYVALKGSFNYQYPAGELMNLSGDTLWWLSKELPDGKYFYQYNVEGIKNLADPWSKDVEWKIPGTEYESGNYEEARTVIEVGREPFAWADVDFSRPAIEDAIVYEMHVGDFSGNTDGSGTFQEILAKIEEGYFDSLGINVVELMPVNEFEGALSWGYNPSFYLAPETSYGTPDELREVINAFHQRGIAVLMDVVFNHMWGSAPLFQLYQPLNNWNWQEHDYTHCPYFHNQESPWGYKLEHWHGTTPAGLPRRTWKYVTDCLRMWVEEYHIDGFRFDHTQGIGWDNTGANGMNFYADFLRDLDSTLLLIAEEDNSYQVNHSEVDAGWNYSYYHMTKANLQEISDGGFTWGNMLQVTGEIRASSQGFNQVWGPLNYCESHDETRIIYEGMHYQGFTREKAIKKSKLGAALLFTSQGTPMIYHGQEFGQDGNSRTSSGYIQPQPLKWNYLNTDEGAGLFRYYKRLIWLRKNREALKTGTLTPKLISSARKCVVYWRLSENEEIVAALNFAGESKIIELEFPHTGTWFEYINDDTLNVDTTLISDFTIPASSALIFCDFKDWESLTGIDRSDPITVDEFLLLPSYPNPFNAMTTIPFVLDKPGNVIVKVYDLRGNSVILLDSGFLNAGVHSIRWDGKDAAGEAVPSGIYFLQLEAAGKRAVSKITMLR